MFFTIQRTNSPLSPITIVLRYAPTPSQIYREFQNEARRQPVTAIMEGYKPRCYEE